MNKRKVIKNIHQRIKQFIYIPKYYTQKNWFVDFFPPDVNVLSTTSTRFFNNSLCSSPTTPSFKFFNKKWWTNNRKLSRNVFNFGEPATFPKTSKQTSSLSCNKICKSTCRINLNVILSSSANSTTFNVEIGMLCSRKRCASSFARFDSCEAEQSSSAFNLSQIEQRIVIWNFRSYSQSLFVSTA